MRTFVSVLIVAVLLATAFSSAIDAADNPIVPADSKLELLFTRTAKLSGGLVPVSASSASKIDRLHPLRSSR